MVSAEKAGTYRVPPEERGYYELSIAIVRYAVEDYRKFRMRYLANQDSGAYGQMRDLRAFFLSELFERIAPVDDGAGFLFSLDSEIDVDFEEGKKRKRMKQRRVVK